MPGLSSSTKLGNTGVSSLIRSANSLSSQLNIYHDDIQSLTYANSAYTDDAFRNYQDYLTGRINQLNTTGNISDATKAITLTKTLESATHSNISASITRENIQIMAGNASLTDKYNLIVGQYQRAMGIGDLTLAQTLEKQAYDVNQSIQYQAQQASDAAAALAKAGNGTTSGTSGVSYQGQVVTNLTAGLKYLNGLAKNTSEKELNANLAAYAKQAAPQLNALGVHIPGSQPNYFDVVYGVAGAIYNAKVLQAQAEAPINPLVSRTYATEAANYLSGQTKISTLAGNLTVQQIQQAQQDPNMFAYDNTTGSYKMTTQTGYQYMPMTGADGSTTQQLVPTYSGIVGTKQANQVYFLSPQETTTMVKLGLNFSQNKPAAGQIGGTTGDGVQVQASANTPDWFKKIVGENGVTNMFTDHNGFVSFKAGATGGQGDSYYTLATDNKGLAGLYEHLTDGSTQLVGGNYGFASSAVNLLINQGQQVQQQVRVAQAATQAKLELAQQQASQALQVQQAQQAATAAQQSQARQIQSAASPQPRTVSPQMPTYNPQPATVNPQQTVNGPNLNQSGTGGIGLHMPTLTGIRL